MITPASEAIKSDSSNQLVATDWAFTAVENKKAVKRLRPKRIISDEILENLFER